MFTALWKRKVGWAKTLSHAFDMTTISTFLTALQNVFRNNSGICVIMTKWLRCKPEILLGPSSFWSLWKRNLRHCPPLSWRTRPGGFCVQWNFFHNLPATDPGASSQLLSNWDANSSLWLITLPLQQRTKAAVTRVCRLSNKWLQLSVSACWF